MSNKFRKVLAAILAGTMVLGSGVVANAAEGSGEGTGSVDVVEAKDVFNVVLPTDAGKQFNYILDPNSVIAQTNFEKYGGTASASFETGKTMYFRHEPASPNNVATYSNVSAPIKAYNKSTMDVEIQVKAKLATPSGIIISTSSVATQTSGTATPSIYLALADGNGTPIEAITTTERVVATSSIGNAEANYIVKYASDSDTYKTWLATGSNAKTEAEYDAAGFQSYSFTLTGDCNPNGEWIGLTEEPPKVTLVWTIQKPEGAVEVGNGPSVTVTSGGLVTVSGLTATKNYKGAKITDAQGDAYDLVADAVSDWPDNDLWSSETGGTLKFQLASVWINALKGKTGKVTIILTDDTTIEAVTNII